MPSEPHPATGPPLSAAAESPPKPLYAHARADGWVEVTWSLPGLRRAVVASPPHLARPGVSPELGRAIAGSLRDLELQDSRLGRRLPG